MPRVNPQSRPTVRRPSTRRWLTPLLVLLTMFGTTVAAHAEKVGTRYKKDADFSGLETYTWRLNTERPADSPLAEGGEIDTMIRGIVTEELERRGFRPAADDATPDFEVSYDALIETMVDHPALRKEISPGVAFVMEGDYRSWQKGSLYIWVYREGGQYPLWTGWATRNLANPEEGPDPKRLRRAVRKMLRKFPAR